MFQLVFAIRNEFGCIDVDAAGRPHLLPCSCRCSVRLRRPATRRPESSSCSAACLNLRMQRPRSLSVNRPACIRSWQVRALSLLAQGITCWLRRGAGGRQSCLPVMLLQLRRLGVCCAVPEAACAANECGTRCARVRAAEVERDDAGFVATARVHAAARLSCGTAASYSCYALTASNCKCLECQDLRVLGVQAEQRRCNLQAREDDGGCEIGCEHMIRAAKQHSETCTGLLNMQREV